MRDIAPITVRFGGEARECWTNSGLTVTYSGGVELRAVFDPQTPGGWRAEVPEPERSSDVKAEMADYSRARELCCLINGGSAPPLTTAYFRAAAGARTDLSAGVTEPPEDALLIRALIEGRFDALRLPETLRLLLDTHSLGWDEAMGVIARSFVYDSAPSQRPERALYAESAPLPAIAALQPRTARLISAVNEKLCEQMWRVYPGDWRRIGSAAVIMDDTVSFPRLAAVMCGQVHCTPEENTGKFRALYTIMPEKFEDSL